MRRRDRIRVVVALIFAAGSAAALWSSSLVTVYSAATLTGRSTRVDTIVVSDVAMQQKPDQYVLSLSGTTQAAATDSQFKATVKSIRGGLVKQIGSDSLLLRPDPSTPGTQVGEDRVLRWVADSLQITTRNPMSQSVTGAAFTVTAQRLP
ncbi:MAG TPA: hypothetical protein VMX57_03940 [Planctomycetota bacterium]|nr:hypothetical protein [Planctomycetota bacterium]